ncbi:TetR/AcrR family transcriptional regulator [Chelatococcus reniformis]|uniref:TetR family transcriptional regulator n=1 Tax=Chelatococcus reniformis TaxID=1494448 RepID=A0A916TWG9_9HYPH|nr:TetR/AcrR family transcriptional regulator [Chelatococcus reniformis]GGC45187.1 TetR family transcriptional regulator [Chelatococcus reniformis]
MEHGPKRRGGRPWSFDRDRAVETAMRLFWRHGYEGVSLGDLTKAIGVAPPSLYAAFGSKAGLFREALARYATGMGVLDMGASAATLEQAVRRLLEGAARAVTAPERERGCMISSGLTTCHPDHEALAGDVAARRQAMREAIEEGLRPFVGAGETGPLARHLAAVMQGMSVQARDGATPADLQEIVEEVVAGLAARRGSARPTS